MAHVFSGFFFAIFVFTGATGCTNFLTDTKNLTDAGDIVFTDSFSKSTKSHSIISGNLSKTEIFLIGALHEKHAEHPYYSITVLEDIFTRLSPHSILIECPLDRFNNGKYDSGWLRALENDSDEASVAWRYCKKHQIECLPYDIHGRDQVQNNPPYSSCFTAVHSNWSKFAEEHPDTAEIFFHLHAAYYACFSSVPSNSNSLVCDSITKNKHEANHTLSEKFLNNSDSDMSNCPGILLEFWETRNRAMANNICRHAQKHPGARIAVTTGLEHRPYLIQYLTEDCPNVELKEFYDIIDAK